MDGVALHAGGLPGYPSSHGCVHLPSEFARLLFGITQSGTTVVIAGTSTAPRSVVHPAALTPVDAATGAAESDRRLGLLEGFRWEPEAAPTGPLTLVASAADERLIVMRNGVEIGRARIKVNNASKPLGTHAYTVLAGVGSGHPRWSAVGLPGHAAESGGAHDENALERLHLPQALTSRIYPLLGPGTTLMVTDASILKDTTGPSLAVLGSGLPQGAPIEEIRIN